MTLALLAIAVIFLIGLAVVATVVVTTRMGISIHHNVIELLHLIGAHPGARPGAAPPGAGAGLGAV